MSGQKVSAVIREAIWIAHSKKCAYTHELVDLSSLHIDHIIPESLADSPEELARLKTDLGLDEQFNLFGLENLLPAKPGANLSKRDLLLKTAAMHFFLSLASQKKSEVERNIARIERRLEQGRALIVLQQLLETGQIRANEVATILDSPKALFRLADRLQFADDSEISAIAKADLSELKDRPIWLGGGWSEGLPLWRGTDKVFVKTCREYENARHDGFEANCNADQKMTILFEQQCRLFAAIEQATLPTISYVAEPRVGVPDIQLLPFSLFPDLSGERPAKDNAMSYQDKVTAGEIIVKEVTSNLLRVQEPAGMGQRLIEIMRADFDNNGLEEILVFELYYATHGTFGTGGVLLLSRTDASPFEFLRL